MAMRSGRYGGKRRIVSSWAFNRSSRTHLLCLSLQSFISAQSFSFNKSPLHGFCSAATKFSSFLDKDLASYHYACYDKLYYQSQKWSSGLNLGFSSANTISLSCYRITPSHRPTTVNYIKIHFFSCCHKNQQNFLKFPLVFLFVYSTMKLQPIWTVLRRQECLKPLLLCNSVELLY
jgi:hypothetical protein